MLQINKLSKSYNGKPALRGISLNLQPGEIYGLLGPNGAGKTTTIKILSGLLGHDSGEIRVAGEPYHRNNNQIKQKIAYVPDQPFVYAKLTGEEHLLFYADATHGHNSKSSLRQEYSNCFFSAYPERK